ncbi:cupin domain-containing protein [Halovenus marina]|uniref:cupin domain-containing protein n=1 Tax=Halovenus marina TaxID=3396621 RepID=UPI003F54EA3B
MTEGFSNIAELNPHVVRDNAAETDGEFVRFESTMYPSSTDPTAARELSHEPWGLDNDFEHVHPEQEERWKVLAGKLRIAVDGDEQILEEGEETTLPSDVPHRHWNPTDRPIRVRWERRPAFQTEAWAESVYALAQAGKTNEEGVPDPLQIAVWIDAFPAETAYPTVAPVSIQKRLSALFAPVGRLAGYEAQYSRETTGTEE